MSASAGACAGTSAGVSDYTGVYKDSLGLKPRFYKINKHSNTINYTIICEDNTEYIAFFDSEDKCFKSYKMYDDGKYAVNIPLYWKVNNK